MPWKRSDGAMEEEWWHHGQGVVAPWTRGGGTYRQEVVVPWARGGRVGKRWWQDGQGVVALTDRRWWHSGQGVLVP